MVPVSRITENDVSQDCQQCGAKCCRYFCLEIDTPEDIEDYENIRWFLMHKGVTVHIDEGKWYMAVATPCVHLGEDNRCRIYKDRPLICREYGHESCENSEGDYGYEAEFRTAAHIEAYAMQQMGEKVYLRKQKQHRAKAGKPATKPIRKRTKKNAK